MAKSIKPVRYFCLTARTLKIVQTDNYNKVNGLYYCKFPEYEKKITIAERNSFDTLEEAVDVVCYKIDERIKDLEDLKQTYRNLLGDAKTV